MGTESPRKAENVIAKSGKDKTNLLSPLPSSLSKAKIRPSTRTLRFFREKGITTPEELAKLTRSEVLSHPTMGKGLGRSAGLASVASSRISRGTHAPSFRSPCGKPCLPSQTFPGRARRHYRRANPPTDLGECVQSSHNGEKGLGENTILSISTFSCRFGGKSQTDGFDDSSAGFFPLGGPLRANASVSARTRNYHEYPGPN